jgi:sugar O-acyltransferase (sialic acid O-acetyltransferase NeuD family)
MLKYFVIWGCAGHAKVLVSLIKSQGGQVIAFFDKSMVASILPNVPIYIGETGFNTWINELQEISPIYGAVAVGGHSGSDRMVIQKKFRFAGLKLDPLIHPTSFVCDTARIGEGSQVLAQAVVAAECELGEVCIINHKASVDHECILGHGVHIAPGATVCGCVTIGDNVMIGAGSVILPRITIGHDSIIGAGAVVTKDVPERSIIVGNPGRIRC